MADHTIAREIIAQSAINQKITVAIQNAGAAKRDKTAPSGGNFSATNAALVQIPIANDKLAAPAEAKTPARVFHIEIVLTSFSKIAYAFTSRSTYAVRIVAPRDVSVEIEGCCGPTSRFDI